MRCLQLRHPEWIAVWTVLAGLIFSPLASAATTPRFDISRFVVQGNTLLPAAEIDALLAPYQGANRDFADVQRALAALQAAYAKHGFTLVKVALPEQELNEGIVRLLVIETRIRKVEVEGNRFFDTANIRRSLPALREGETVNVGRLSASLAQANENPAKKTTVQLQGAREGEVDARVIVADEKPWTVGLSVDNTGNTETGKTMLGVVYQNANILGLDHVLSLQYTTTAEKPERVKVYGVGYHMPIYALADSLDLYANYSDVDSGSILAGIFDLQVSGKGTVAGARYNHSFGRIGAFDSTVSLGLDYKAYRNGITFQGFELGNDVTVHPLSLAYGGTWKTDASTTAFIVTGVRNVPGGDRGSQDDFDRVRFNAPASYTLARYGVAHTHSLPADWEVRIAAAGQYSRDALVPGEQFGAGGMTSVRGFLSREVAGDKGISASAEIYTPDLCGRWQGAATFCRVLAFYDVANISRNDTLPGESAHASIGSIGAGLRAAMGRYLTLALDFGHVIDSGPVDTKGHNRVNFKLSLSY